MVGTHNVPDASATTTDGSCHVPDWKEVQSSTEACGSACPSVSTEHPIPFCSWLSSRKFSQLEGLKSGQTWAFQASGEHRWLWMVPS